MVRPSGRGGDDAERARVRAWDANARDRHAGAVRDVLLDHLPGVHPVDVVGPEDHDVVGISRRR